ncbi:glucans biosynthesis protein G precursor [mine drainage metagenome]|uniref:Glucans biosynthesis protein G n=1 Tax=mine drainage metagenome TaxID=410659 RepID=A0A1J5SHU5_9ZZZZ
MHVPRHFLVLAGLLLVVPGRILAKSSDSPVDYEVLRYRAKMLAASAYSEPPSRVPAWLLAPKFTYDDYRRIVFDQGHSWWLRERLPFQLQFFHPGFIYSKTVQLHELQGNRATPIPFDRDFFDYGGMRLAGPIPSDVGYSGFRIEYPLNTPRKMDELAVFQGASYFRALCTGAVYGLSARGIAVDTVDANGEEFPDFTDFWIRRPSVDAKEITVYALLDGPSITGAYRFDIRPGDDTVMHVRCTLFLRKPVKVLGIAPLTSMYWHGENSEGCTDDYRPEVHDSDGLMIAHGGGEWLWRPLEDPKRVTTSSFADQNPKGFGLLQRDRAFSSYEDLEANYNLRPSAWVEPIGNWGKGCVRLVEIPTPDETNDNIVAFWQPDTLPAPGEPIEFEYRLHWFLKGINPPAGYTIATRMGRSRTHETDLERFIVDFDGPYLHNQPDDPSIKAAVSVGAGATLVSQTVQKNHYNGSWRVSFAVRPDGSGRPVELRCFLQKPPHVLTETWSYRWTP